MSPAAKSTTRTFTSVVDAPLADVFSWHERPGAIARLTPPWQPVRVAEEAGSLYDGRAVLALPGGLRWIAQHQPADYAAPYRFADELSSFPLNAALKWRHEHDFAAETEHRTRVTDRIDTQLPDLLLSPMFTYRHRQLADDLSAHRWASDLAQPPLTVAVTGSSGLIGSSLVSFLTSGGHRVIRLVRRRAQGADEREWRPEAPDDGLLDGVDALVHLAGAPIFGRFTEATSTPYGVAGSGPPASSLSLSPARRTAPGS
jgi:ligand-binding SRPBCC domain-containing protein